MTDNNNTDLEKARAEVKRLELEANTIPFTKDIGKSIKGLITGWNELTALLGMERLPNAGNGGGATVLRTIEALAKRITQLEAETRGDFGMPANVAIRCLQDRVEMLEAQRAPQPSKSNEARDAAVMDYCNSIATAHTRATTSISANTREAYAGGRRIGPEPTKAAENTREPAKAKPWCSHLKVNFAPLHPVTGADDHQYHATEAEAYEHLVTSLRVQRDTLKAEYEALQKRHETYVRESEAVITDLRKRLNGGEA